jgi:long-chain acyl-CoA synthetase
MQNFHEQFARITERFPDRLAVEVQGRDRVDGFTYSTLETMAARTAAWLAGVAISQGHRCAILAENDAHWCAAYLGILRLGAVAVPLDTAYKAAQVATLMVDSGVRIIFTSQRYVATVRAARELSGRTDVTIVLLHGTADDVASFEAIATRGGETGPPVPQCPCLPDDPAVILYTSGTTSDPKGVVLTHGNLLAEREGALSVVSVSEQDCVLGVLPLFHALAQMANLLLPFSVGARVVFLETVNTSELLRGLAERGVTIFVCVPQFFYLIHQRVMQEVTKASAPKRLIFRSLLAANGALRRVGLNAGRVLFSRVHGVLGGSMRILITGGSRFDPAIGADLFRLGFNILQAYGLTETSGAATIVRPGDSHLDSVGQVLPNAEIRVLAPATGDDDALDGEVLVRGPIVMAGYFNRPDATVEAIRDGWFYTGDLGRIDSDGRLTITGRKKEIIVLSNGKNIYPEEIEAHYRQSPFIKELCVLGLMRPGEPSAERLYAVVVPDADALREKKVVNAGDLIRFEMEGRSVGLAPPKRVLGYEVSMEPLPRTSTGKLKRFEIERRARQTADARARGAHAAATDEDREWAARPEVAPILAVIQRAARDGAIARPDANLELDLGLDSMERIELLSALEQRFRARVSEQESARIFSVRELVEAIRTYGSSEGPEETASAWGTILASDPPENPHLAGLLEARPVATMLLFVALRSLLGVARLLLRIEVSGREHLPARGPYLISPNHQSYIDSFLVAGTLPFRVFRQLFFVGASEYFETAFTARLARLARVIPVDPDSSLVPAMQAGGFGLRHDKVLVLFPEGERSIDGTVKAFKKGAAILSHHLAAPIVPVAIDGVYQLWPRNRPINWALLRPWRRPGVAVRFGPLLPAPVLAATGASEGVDSLAEPSYAITTARLRDAVDRMWREIRVADPGTPPA